MGGMGINPIAGSRGVIPALTQGMAQNDQNFKMMMASNQALIAKGPDQPPPKQPKPDQTPETKEPPSDDKTKPPGPDKDEDVNNDDNGKDVNDGENANHSENVNDDEEANHDENENNADTTIGSGLLNTSITAPSVNPFASATT